jgi:hypothetical protein
LTEPGGLPYDRLMQVNRGELSSDPLGPARRRELEELQGAAAIRRAAADQSPAIPEEGGLTELRRRALVAQRYVARAQAVLGGLEGFRDFLLGAPRGEAEAAEAILRAHYQGEPVLEAHRASLLAIAARGDVPLLERWIGTVRETVAGLAGELSRGEAPGPEGAALQGLLEGIRRSGAGLEKLQRENVLKLLS